MCTTNNEKTWDLIIKTVLRKDIVTKQKIQLSAYNMKAQQEQKAQDAIEISQGKMNRTQTHADDLKAILGKGSMSQPKLPTLKKTIELNAGSLDKASPSKGIANHRLKKYPDILIRNNMRVTKDRVYNDFRNTLKEIIDVKNGLTKPDGLSERYNDDILSDNSL